MSDFAEYLQRLVALNREGMSGRDVNELLTADGLHKFAEDVIPSWERLAERAGLDLRAMFDDLAESLMPTFALVMVRSRMPGHDPVDELGSLVVSIATQMFLAGVNWEQERNMPPAPGGET